MNIANGPVRPTPANLHPPIDYCIQLTLPNDREWIGAFYDALYQLTYWFAWARDEEHTGKDIAAVWLSVLANMRTCKPTPSEDGCCDGGEPLYRQNPDNPCILESSADGVHWCTLFDVSLCVPSTGQPGGGAEQPEPGGGETCYHLNQQAAYQILVPTVVNAGDLLTFSNFGGAANDGVPGRWDCPDGKYFFAGTCQDGTQGTNGTDPMPTAPHMSLIAQIAGVWYTCLEPLTVPGGVSNAQVLIQLNDAAIGDNQGQYALDVCVQNNVDAEWVHTLELAVNQYGFEVVDAFGCSSGAFGEWIAGSGFQATDCVNAFTIYRTLQIQRMFTEDVSFTAVSFTYDGVPGTSPGSTNHLRYIESIASGGGVTPVNSGTMESGTGKTAQAGEAFTARGLGLWLGVDSIDVPGPATGSARAYRLTVAGTGYDPFAAL